MKIITITLFLFLIAGCITQQTFEERASSASDEDLCKAVYWAEGPMPQTSRTEKRITSVFQLYEEEMKARNLNCSERFPNAGYEGPTYLETLLQEEE